MYPDITINKKDCKRVCPNCGKESRLEWVGGKVDNTEQEYICRNCRIYVKLIGMTSEDQEIIAEEAFA